MKEIKAIIRPNKLPVLRDALVVLPGFPGMTVSKVEGCSAPTRHVPAKVKIKDELTDYTPKVRVEIVAPDEVAEAITAGWSTVSLGRRILRVETAAVLVMAMLIVQAG